MKVKDRGTKKWTSIMMPEHIEKLEEMWTEQNHESMPELDEQQIQENEINIQEALQDDLKINIKYFANNKYKNIEGHLQYVIDVNIL